MGSTPSRLTRAMPEMPMDDVAASVSYHRDILGFSVNHEQSDIGVMDRDDVRILLVPRTVRHAGVGSCYVYVTDADALHAELTANGAAAGEVVSRSRGLREFEVHDPAGNRITFGQPLWLSAGSLRRPRRASAVS